MVKMLGLSSDDLQAVDAFMRHEYELAHLTARELLDRLFHTDRTQDVKDNSRPRPTWSPEQLRVFTLLSNFAGHGLYPPDSCKRGIARRIALDSPQELALFLALGARYEWISKGHGRQEPERNLFPILQAAAAHDFATARRFVETGPATIKRPEVRMFVPVYYGIVALLTSNSELLNRCSDEMKRRKPPAYLGGMYEVLQGVADVSPDRVASGLERMLRAYPAFAEEDPVMRLIAPEVHGLYELCRQASGDLVSQFDIGRKSPWDAEYAEWVSTCTDPLRGLDLNDISPEYHAALIELRRPIWWDAKLELDWEHSESFTIRFKQATVSAGEIMALHKLLPAFRDKPLSDVRAAIGDRNEFPLGMLRPAEVFQLEASARALRLDIDIERA